MSKRCRTWQHHPDRLASKVLLARIDDLGSQDRFAGSGTPSSQLTTATCAGAVLALLLMGKKPRWGGRKCLKCGVSGIHSNTAPVILAGRLRCRFWSGGEFRGPLGPCISGVCDHALAAGLRLGTTIASLASFCFGAARIGGKQHDVCGG